MQLTEVNSRFYMSKELPARKIERDKARVGRCDVATVH